MRDVLRKWIPWGKCVKNQNFPTHFGLSLSLECSGEIFTTVRQICMPDKFTQSGCIPPKIKCAILACKGS